MSMATIRDVAREAGVSIATVSNTLNKPSVVKPETRDLVMEAVQKLGYVPNLNARSLSSRRSNLIGVLIPQTEPGTMFRQNTPQLSGYHKRKTWASAKPTMSV